MTLDRANWDGSKLGGLAGPSRTGKNTVVTNPMLAVLGFVIGTPPARMTGASP